MKQIASTAWHSHRQSAGSSEAILLCIWSKAGFARFWAEIGSATGVPYGIMGCSRLVGFSGTGKAVARPAHVWEAPEASFQLGRGSRRVPKAAKGHLKMLRTRAEMFLDAAMTACFTSARGGVVASFHSTIIVRIQSPLIEAFGNIEHRQLTATFCSNW